MVDSANQPIRRQCRRGCSSGHKAKVTRSGAGGDSFGITLPEVVQCRYRALATFGQLVITRLKLLCIQGRANRALFYAAQKRFGQLTGVIEDLWKLVKVLLQTWVHR